MANRSIKDQLDKVRGQAFDWGGEVLKDLQTWSSKHLEVAQGALDQAQDWSQERLTELDGKSEGFRQQGEEIRKHSEEFINQAQGTVRGAEATVLELAREMLVRGRQTLGPKAEFLQKGEEAIDEVLVGVRSGHTATLPVADFDGMNVKKAVSAIADLDLISLRTLRAYEVRSKNRVTLLRAIDKRMGQLQPTAEA